MRSTRTASLVTTTLIALLLSGLGQAQEETDSGIRAQPLTKALAEFADQTGMQLVYPSELTAGVYSNGASTRGTPDEILDQLLTSTGLEYEYINDRTIAIAASVVVGVDNESGGSALKNSTLVPMLMAQNTSSQVQTTVSSRSGSAKEAQEGKSLVPLEEIIVTGTNIRGVENPTTPVFQLNRDEIQKSGAVSVADLGRLIPQNFASTAPTNTSSGNPFDQAGINNAQGTAVDLRGLGAGSTLVLVNGRRLGNTGLSSFFDVSVLPLSVMQRVDVLTDGASAIYGTDAVGGVVNYITDTSFEGLEIRTRYGDIRGSGNEFGVGATGGLDWDSGGAFVSFDYAEADRLEIRDRDFVDLDVANPRGTFLPERNEFSIAASLNQNLNERLSAGIDFFYSQSDRESVGSVFNTDSTATEVDSLYILSNATYQISDEWIIDGFFDYGSNETNSIRESATTSFENIDENSIVTIEGRVSGPLLTLPGGKVSSAIGMSYREEEYDTPTSATILSGDPKREVISIYGELLAPIVGPQNGVPLVHALDLSVAGRYEDYNDFGDTLNPKFGLRWVVNDQFSIRGTYGESFRAPSLRDTFRQEQVLIGAFPRVFFPNNESIPQNPNAPDGTIVAIAGPQLGGVTEETAEAWSVGIEYQPSFAPRLELEFGYFNAAYTDRVRITSLGEVLLFSEFNDLLQYNPDPQFVAEVLATPGADLVGALPFDFTPDDFQAFTPNGLINVSEFDVESLDARVQYQRSTAIGDVSTQINASYILTYETRTLPTSESMDTAGLIYRPSDLSLRASLGWAKGPFELFFAVNHRSGTDNDQVAPVESVGRFTVVDIAVTLDAAELFNQSWSENLSLSLTIQNLFDEEPPFAETLDGLNYDPANADPLGRVTRVNLRKKF